MAQQHPIQLEPVFRLIKDSMEQGLESELFQLLFTANELEQLVARYGIIQGLLQKKETQRQLAERLQVSIEKITRGSNELKRLPKSLSDYLVQFFNREKQ